MDKRPIIFSSSIIWLAALLSSCWGQGGRYHTDEQHKQVDEFYTTTGGWDWIRVPLIKPYEAKKVDPEIETNGWGMKLQSKLYQIDRLKCIDVEDSIMYILSGKIDENEDYTAIGTRNVPTAWYIIDTRKKAEKGFASEQEFEQYIRDNKYPAPKWHDIDSLSKALGNGGKVPWLPE